MPSTDEIDALNNTTDYCLDIYKELVACLEYACTISSDARRGIFIKAYVEDEDWAIRDFNAWHRKQKKSRSP